MRKKDYPIMYECSTSEINRILDETVGKTFCKKCNKKINYTDMKAGMLDKKYCLICYKKTYGRDHYY